MNSAGTPAFISGLTTSLREFLQVCHETHDLTARENQALTSTEDYQPFLFYQGRKALLSRLDSALNLLSRCRRTWQQIDPAERAQYPEVKSLLQTAQDSLVKVLLLDRENQQALLRRGRLPAQHVPSFASQQPNYAARVYRRHSPP